MIKVVDAKVLLVDIEDFEIFVVMMKKIAVAFNLLSTGTKAKVVAVHSNNVDRVMREWAARGFKYEWISR